MSRGRPLQISANQSVTSNSVYFFGPKKSTPNRPQITCFQMPFSALLPKIKKTCKCVIYRVFRYFSKCALRRERDSNPRYSCPYTAFRVRPDRPLRHLSFRCARNANLPRRRPRNFRFGSANIDIFFCFHPFSAKKFIPDEKKRLHYPATAGFRENSVYLYG